MGKKNNSNSTSGGFGKVIVSFLASAVVAYFFTSVYMARQPEKEITKDSSGIQIKKSAGSKPKDSSKNPVKPVKQIVVSFSTPVETSRNVYKFNAYTDLDKSVPVMFELCSINNNDTIIRYTSTDGAFNGVAARNEGYLLRAVVNKSNDNRKSRYIQLTGFTYHAERIDKLTVDEVRSLIVSRKADNDKHFARNVKLNFVNKKEPDNIVSFEKVGQQLMFKQWKDIVVKNLSFTTDNHIREVTIEIIYP